MTRGMQAELNRRLIAQVVPNRDVAVDGLRHPLDYESLKNAFGSAFHLLYLDSSQEKRWERKNAKEKCRSLAAFRAADSHPVERQIESLRSSAALVLRNEGSLQDLYALLDERLQGFRKAGDT
jgi:hypothetical protein